MLNYYAQHTARSTQPRHTRVCVCIRPRHYINVMIWLCTCHRARELFCSHFWIILDHTLYFIMCQRVWQFRRAQIHINTHTHASDQWIRPYFKLYSLVYNVWLTLAAHQTAIHHRHSYTDVLSPFNSCGDAFACTRLRERMCWRVSIILIYWCSARLFHCHPKACPIGNNW